MISVCYIVKNEEKWLKDAIENLAPFVTEFIVVDTGSTDRTRQIAEAKNCKVFDFTWTNDFSEARNFAISKATQPWILNIDPDERIDSKDFARIQELLKVAQTDAFRFRIRNYTPDPYEVGFKECKGEYPLWETSYPGYFDSRRVKVFRNFKGIHFVGRIHELVESTVQTPIEECEVPIHHYGHSPEEMKRKSKTSVYLERLIEKVKIQPEDWQSLCQLAFGYIQADQFSAAIPVLEKAWAIQKSHFLLSQLGTCYHRSGNITLASEVFSYGLRLFPEDHDISFNFAVMLVEQKQWNPAIQILQLLISHHPHSSIALRVLGFVFLNINNLKMADDYLQRAISLQPRYEDALVDLAVVRLSQGRSAEAFEISKKLVEISPQNPRVQSLQAVISQQI